MADIKAWVLANRPAITVVLTALLALWSILGHLDCGTAETIHSILDALGFNTPLECTAEMVSSGV